MDPCTNNQREIVAEPPQLPLVENFARPMFESSGGLRRWKLGWINERVKVPFLISISCSGRFAETEIRADEREGELPFFFSDDGSRRRKLGWTNERVKVPF